MLISILMKYNTTAIHTDKQVTQSNGFNLWNGFNPNPFLIAFGNPAIFTK
jgi:hypothetical protein